MVPHALTWLFHFMAIVVFAHHNGWALIVIKVRKIEIVHFRQKRIFTFRFKIKLKKSAIMIIISIIFQISWTWIRIKIQSKKVGLLFSLYFYSSSIKYGFSMIWILGNGLGIYLFWDKLKNLSLKSRIVCPMWWTRIYRLDIVSNWLVL